MPWSWTSPDSRPSSTLSAASKNLIPPLLPPSPSLHFTYSLARQSDVIMCEMKRSSSPSIVDFTVMFHASLLSHLCMSRIKIDHWFECSKNIVLNNLFSGELRGLGRGFGASGRYWNEWGWIMNCLLKHGWRREMKIHMKLYMEYHRQKECRSSSPDRSTWGTLRRPR